MNSTESNLQLKKYLTLLLVSGLVIAADQWTKWWVRTTIPENAAWQPDWLAATGWPARFVHWYNTGAAFGIFQNGNTIFAVLGVIVAVAIVYYYQKIAVTDVLFQLAVGLYLGGVLGNLIDRVTLGKVTDFVSIGSFAVFNVADSSINVGVALLLLDMWMKVRKEKKEVREPS